VFDLHFQNYALALHVEGATGLVDLIVVGLVCGAAVFSVVRRHLKGCKKQHYRRGRRASRPFGLNGKIQVGASW